MRSVICAVALMLAGSSVYGQSIRGQVVDSVSGAGIPKGFVVLLDRNRTEVGRALTDAEGRFTISAPSAGTYRLRSERIGFRALTSEPMTLHPNAILDYRLQVTALPVRLANLSITGETSCRAMGEQQAALAVWEEARKALAAVAWTESRRLAFALRLSHRMLTPTYRVERDSVRVVMGTASQSFSTLPARRLASQGYISPLPDGGLVFHGPDAQVLFSNEFLSQHCFRVVRSATSPGLIGLFFEPLRSRRAADITGTMWLDDATAELKHIDYSYVNHGLVGVKDEAGGRVEFSEIADGYWIVQRWRIRLPVVEPITVSSMSPGRSFRMRPDTAAITGFVEDGGEVMQVWGADRVVLAGIPATTVHGRVTDPEARALEGVIVQLTGTSHRATSGVDGAFRFDRVPEGVYGMQYIHPWVPVLGAMTVPEMVISAVPGRDTTIQVTIPGVIALLDQACPARDVVERHSALAGGVVRLPDLSPVTTIKIRVAWPLIRVSNLGGRPLFTSEWDQVEISPGSGGRYLACDLPPGRNATIFATAGASDRAVGNLTILPDTIHQRNLGVLGDSVFARGTAAASRLDR